MAPVQALTGEYKRRMADTDIEQRINTLRQEMMNMNSTLGSSPPAISDIVQKDIRLLTEKVTLMEIIILTRTGSLGSLIGDDVHIEQNRKEVNDPGVSLTPTKRPTPPGPPGGGGGGTPTKKRQKSATDKQHRVSNGRYTHNRSGLPLCEAFQTGACKETIGNKCANNPSLGHH